MKNTEAIADSTTDPYNNYDNQIESDISSVVEIAERQPEAECGEVVADSTANIAESPPDVVYTKRYESWRPPEGCIIYRVELESEEEQQLDNGEQYAYVDRISVGTHRGTHTREKPYSCDSSEKPKKNYRFVSNLDYSKLTERQRQIFGRGGICPRSYANDQGLQAYVCDICLLHFSFESRLENHKRSHIGEKPFECHICLTRFSDRVTFHNHKSGHLVDKPFTCENCNLSFRFVYDLDRHLRQKSCLFYVCDICNITLRSRDSFVSHQRSHRVEPV